MDIVALSETRLSEQGQLEEVGAGYTFFWSGRHKAERRDEGVVFTIRTALSVVGHRRSPDEPPSSSPRRQIRPHRLRSADDQPRRRTGQILACSPGDSVEGG
nr:unnamed protein product [Spirometra erinaceieuropaei]